MTDQPTDPEREAKMAELKALVKAEEQESHECREALRIVLARAKAAEADRDKLAKQFDRIAEIGERGVLAGADWKARAEAAEAEVERLRKVVQQAASDVTSAGLDWQSNRYGMKSHGGRGLFFRHTHVLFRLLHALKPQPQEAMTEVGIDLARPGSEDKSVKATRYPDGTVHIEEIRSDD